MQSVLTKSTTFPSLSCNKIEFKYLKPIWGKKKFEHQSAICARFCFSLKVHQGGKHVLVELLEVIGIHLGWTHLG